MNLNNDQNKGIFNGVFLGYFVLLLHLLLILGLGVAVVLLKGIYEFRWLIFLAGIILIGGSGYLFYQRLKAGNRRFTNLMNDPSLQNRTLEISLLGGMASIKIGHKDENLQLINSDNLQYRQLESPTAIQLRELDQLTKMLENELITKDEFQHLKKKIVSPE